MKGKKAKEEETVVEATGMLSKNLISHLDPKSLAAESYRTLRTKLHFSSVDKVIKTIVITSPTPADGKSTTGANLAVSLCQEGKKVLLIDGDLRKPKVHKYFGLANSVGLTDILSKDSSIEEAIQHISDIEGLSILVSGTIPPNPAELMGSDRMKAFIEELKASYDIIIIDTPPVVQVTDALIASDFADLILLVVAQGETNIDAAIKARKMFSDTLAPKVSVVYVKVQSGKGYGYGYGYGYYY
jgi:capsular exopolysaccharide synthesis family protein